MLKQEIQQGSRIIGLSVLLLFYDLKSGSFKRLKFCNECLGAAFNPILKIPDMGQCCAQPAKTIRKRAVSLCQELRGNPLAEYDTVPSAVRRVKICQPAETLHDVSGLNVLVSEELLEKKGMKPTKEALYFK